MNATSGPQRHLAGGPVRRFSSGTVWEPAVGYSRAVAAGDFAYVSGCTSVDGAEFVHPGDAYAQTAQAIANVRTALESLGAGLSDVVRTRMFVTDISRWEEYGRAHGDVFATVVPATSMVEVRSLIDPRMLVEVEAVAYSPGIGTSTGAPAAVADAEQQPGEGAS